jgi:hypothetical protein
LCPLNATLAGVRQAKELRREFLSSTGCGDPFETGADTTVDTTAAPAPELTPV